jgi:hypothetical protein
MALLADARGRRERRRSISAASSGDLDLAPENGTALGGSTAEPVIKQLAREDVELLQQVALGGGSRLRLAVQGALTSEPLLSKQLS